jgi:hypothetical protein
MLFLVLAGALVLCLSGTAQAQTDTARRPVPRVAAPARVADSGFVHDIEHVEIPGPWALGGMDSTVRHRMLDTLEARHQVWNRRRPRGYVIRVLSISDCFEVRVGPRAEGELLRDRLLVRDTTIMKREPAPIPAVYEQRCALEWRVDDLFADVRRALADTAAYITGVEYDAAYGFPRAYWLARGYARGGGVLVESFAPARESLAPSTLPILTRDPMRLNY